MTRYDSEWLTEMSYKRWLTLQDRKQNDTGNHNARHVVAKPARYLYIPHTHLIKTVAADNSENILIYIYNRSACVPNYFGGTLTSFKRWKPTPFIGLMHIRDISPGCCYCKWIDLQRWITVMSPFDKITHDLLLAFYGKCAYITLLRHIDTGEITSHIYGRNTIAIL